MAEKSRRWTKQGFIVVARIKDDGKHEVEISGTATFPMYFPGDAYDDDGNPVAMARVRGLFLVKDMMDEAYRWIKQNAPQPPVPRSLQS